MNIRPFGQRAAPGNSAALPNQVRLACIPVIASPWIPGSPSVMPSSTRLVNSDCRCHCQYGGVIPILWPGQQRTKVA